jgi:hypothetical protein
MSSRRPFEALPALLAEIAEVVAEASGSPEAGLRAAVAVAKARGGERVYVSHDMERNAWLLQAVGPAAAEAIVALYASSDIDIPMGEAGGYRAQKRRRRQIIEAGLAEKLPVNEIARQADCTRRFVFWMKARLQGAAADSRQMSLFDDEAA